MSIPAFEMTAWSVPHRDYGRLLYIDTEFPDDNEYGIYIQSLSLHDSASWRSPIFNLERPHTLEKVSEEWILRLSAALDRTVVSLAEQPCSEQLGGTLFGLRVSRALQEITIQWQPRFEDQTEDIRDLWRLLDNVVSRE